MMDDIRMLCRSLAELPDTCQCGNGEGHMKGMCPCCRTVAIERVPSCNDCDAQLAGLRERSAITTHLPVRFFENEWNLSHQNP